MISQIQAAAAAVAAKVSAATVTPTTPPKGDQPPVDKTTKSTTDKASFSPLASQLNESTARAAKREAQMSHAELGKYGKARVDEFLQETPKANSFTRAMEVPNTRDPELLDRARKASEFVSRTIAGDKHAKSPFENLSREQLNVIVYDDSGMFTQNERRAAWHGVQKMDDAWHKTTLSDGVLEQIRTGKASKFYREALSYYKSLPAIEKAVSYPKNTEALINARLKNDATLPGTSNRQAPDRKLTLYDVLAGIVDPKQDKGNSANVGYTRKFTPRTSPTPVTWTEAYMQKRAAREAAKPVAPTPAASSPAVSGPTQSSDGAAPAKPT
jgi:hypothetical protein